MAAEPSGEASPDATRCVPRIVLDTNVCLDLLLFDDPRCARLQMALQASKVRAVTNQACREERLRVLRYPQLGLDAERQDVLSGAFDALMHPLAQCTPPASSCPLPRCKDPDDQKFMALALASGARWLLSRDSDLLALGRRTQVAGWFAILAPQDWSGLTGRS